MFALLSFSPVFLLMPLDDGAPELDAPAGDQYYYYEEPSDDQE
jgi:hypothetical protein